MCLELIDSLVYHLVVACFVLSLRSNAKAISETHPDMKRLIKRTRGYSLVEDYRFNITKLLFFNVRSCFSVFAGT